MMNKSTPIGLKAPVQMAIEAEISAMLYQNLCRFGIKHYLFICLLRGLRRNMLKKILSYVRAQHFVPTRVSISCRRDNFRSSKKIYRARESRGNERVTRAHKMLSRAHEVDFFLHVL